MRNAYLVLLLALPVAGQEDIRWDRPPACAAEETLPAQAGAQRIGGTWLLPPIWEGVQPPRPLRLGPSAPSEPMLLLSPIRTPSVGEVSRSWPASVPFAEVPAPGVAVTPAPVAPAPPPSPGIVWRTLGEEPPAPMPVVQQTQPALTGNWKMLPLRPFPFETTAGPSQWPPRAQPWAAGGRTQDAEPVDFHDDWDDF